MDERDTSYAKAQPDFVDHGPLQFALREVQARAAVSQFWIGLAALTLLLAIAAPYDTDDELSFMGRLGYWGIICGSTDFPAMFVSVLVTNALMKRGIHEIVAILIAGVVASVPVVIVVMTINIFLVGFSPEDATPPGIFVAQCVAISIAIIVIDYLFRVRLEAAAGTAQRYADITDESSSATANDPHGSVHDNPLVARLDFHNRGPVKYLTMEDHYVRVTTTKGEQLVLMRMGDAIAALAAEPGLRVHRSHWINGDYVASTKREAGKLVVVMTDGAEFPVSRTYAPRVRERLRI